MKIEMYKCDYCGKEIKFLMPLVLPVMKENGLDYAIQSRDVCGVCSIKICNFLKSLQKNNMEDKDD